MAAHTTLDADAHRVDEDMTEVKRESPSSPHAVDLHPLARLPPITDESTQSTSASPASTRPTKMRTSRSSSSSTVHSRASSTSSIAKKPHATEEEEEKKVDVKPEPTPAAKPNRSAGRKAVPRVAPLFDHLPDATDEATGTFTVLDACTYANRYLGYTEHAMECDCPEEWGKIAPSPELCAASDGTGLTVHARCHGQAKCGVR